MYRMESGLWGIILTLLLIGFNFYASYKKKKREQIKRNEPQVVNNEPVGEDTGYEEDPFDFFFNKEFNPEEDISEENIEMQEGETVKEEEDPAGEEAFYDNGLDSVENSGPVSRFAAMEEQRGYVPAAECGPVEETPGASPAEQEDGPKEDLREPDREAGLKDRLKRNPRDMVLFSEIFRPRYKDF